LESVVNSEHDSEHSDSEDIADAPEQDIPMETSDSSEANNESEPSSPSSSEDSSVAESTESDDEELVTLLGQFCVTHNITRSAMDSLLRILRNYHPDLPRSAKTVMHTPRGKTAVKNLENGLYCHRGIMKGLSSRLQDGIKAVLPGRGIFGEKRDKGIFRKNEGFFSRNERT